MIANAFIFLIGAMLFTLVVGIVSNLISREPLFDKTFWQIYFQVLTVIIFISLLALI